MTDSKKPDAARCGVQSSDASPTIGEIVRELRAVPPAESADLHILVEQLRGENDRLAEERASLIEAAAQIAEAIDSGRGNEKQIAKSIRALAVSSADRRTDNAPRCGFCGRAVFGPCMSKAQAAGCELPPVVTSTNGK